MPKPFFSIIIPTLNEAQTLPHLLLDLSNQTKALFEVTVVDGGSTDTTASYCKDHMKKDSRFHLYPSKKKNVSLQRNLGSQKSTGVWNIFLDADSRIKSNFLEKLHKELSKSNCDGFTCYAVPDSTELDAIAYVQLQNILLETMASIGTPYSVGACMGVKKSVLQKIGGFNPMIAHMEDSELAKRLHENGYSFKVLHQPNYVYSLRRQRTEGKLAIIKKLFPYYIKSFMHNDFSTPARLYPMRGGTHYKEAKAPRQ